VRSDPARPRSRWHYDGVGWPRSADVVRPRGIATVFIVAFTIWGYTCIAPCGRIETSRLDQHRTDFTVFTEAGAAFFDGRDPYRVASPRGWHYLYPPLFALLIAPLSVFDTQSQVVIWYTFNVVLTFGCVGETRRLLSLLAEADGHKLKCVGTCAALASFLPLLDCMQAGQLGIGILYLLMLGSRQVLEARSSPKWFLGGVILALPATVKLVPALPVVFLLCQLWARVLFPEGGRRALRKGTASTAGVATGTFLFLLAIPASLIGWDKNIHYLKDWHGRVVANEHVGPRSNFNIHSFRNQSFANAVYLWSETTRQWSEAGRETKAPRGRPERIVHPGVRVGIGFVLTLLLAVTVLVGRRNNPLDQATAYGLACCATLVVSPLSWGHYYMAQVPALICAPIWFSSRGLPAIARFVAWTPVGLSWLYYVAMPYTGGLGLLGLGTTLWLVVSCGLIIAVELANPMGVRLRHKVEEQNTGVPPRPHSLVETPARTSLPATLRYFSTARGKARSGTGS
jgi:hypothetical protein